MANVQVRNSQTLKKFLNQQPTHARQAILEWQEFAHDNPDVMSFTTSEEWFSYATSHPGIDKYLWVGKELEVLSSDPRFTESPPEEQNKPEAPGLPGGASFGHAVGGLVSAITKPEILEHDWDYLKTEYELQQKWLKDNNKKDFYSSEGADFLFGSLGDPTKTNLPSQTEEELFELAKTKPKLAKKLEEYGEERKKTVSDLRYDPYVGTTGLAIERELAFRFHAYKEENKQATEEERNKKYQELSKQVTQKAWERFIDRHPEKVKEYTQDKHKKYNKNLIEALAKKEAQKQLDTINRKYDQQQEERSKKQIDTSRIATQEKTHKTSEDMRPEDTISRLANIANAYRQRHPQEGLVNIQQDEDRDEDQSIQLPRRREVEQSQPPSQTPRTTTQRSSPSLPRAPRPPINSAQIGRLAQAGRAIAILGNPVTWVVLVTILIILIFVAIIMFMGGDNEVSFDPTPTTYKPLDITKSVNKTEASVGEEIEYTIRVGSHALAGDRIVVTEQIPPNTTFVRGSNNPVRKGDLLEWELTASKNPDQSNIIPPQNGPIPSGFGRNIQQISVTEDQVRSELIGMDSPYANYAKALFDIGVKHNVDPAFIMGVWYMESAYGANGGYHNNPGSIVYVRDGYLEGQTRGDFNVGRFWGTWPTFEQGLEAIALLIKNEYYPLGQTDTWSIHSGVGETGDHAYHGRGDIGVGEITTWEKYVNFHNSWVAVMDRISGKSYYNINETISFVVTPTANDVWISNTALGFANGTGNTTSNQTVVKVGNPPEETRPGTPTQVPVPPADLRELNRQIMANFRISFSSDFSREYLMAAWEALWKAKQKTPKFFELTQEAFPVIQIITHRGSTETFNATGTIAIGPRTLEGGAGDLFKQILMHELGHIVHGPAGAPRNQIYDQGIQAARSQQGNFTRYCASSNSNDECFAELVSYYILDDIVEQPTWSQGVLWSTFNPLKTGQYSLYVDLAERVLK